LAYFIINEFSDLNFLSPLIIYYENNSLEYKIIMLFENLKKPTKVGFKKSKIEVLNLPFINKNKLVILKNRKLKKYLLGLSGSIIATSPTIMRLNRIYRNKNCKYIAISYFGEYDAEIVDYVDLLFLHSPIFKLESRKNNIRYGVPYWDIYHNSDYDYSHLSDIQISSNTENIIIPEIVLQYEKWYVETMKWLKENYSVNKHYYLKCRIKNINTIKRNKIFKKELKQYSNVHFVNAQPFFHNHKLLKNSTSVMFTSNLSMYVLESIFMKKNIIKYFSHNTKLFLKDHRKGKMDDIIEQYENNKHQTISKYIFERNHYSEYAFEEINSV